MICESVQLNIMLLAKQITNNFYDLDKMLMILKVIQILQNYVPVCSKISNIYYLCIYITY